MRKLSAICSMLALLGAVAYADRKYPMTAASIVPGARAQVEIGKDKNDNTSLRVKVQHLANLENLTPRANAYVVWLQERGSTSENLGQLKVDKNLNGTFESVTPSKKFDLFVTAEMDLKTKTPGGPEILRAAIQP
jgi:hypothetical protein